MRGYLFKKIRRYIYLVGVLSILSALNTMIVNLSWALEPPRVGEIQELKRTGELQNRFKLVNEIKNHQIDGYLLKNAIVRAKQRALTDLGVAREEINRLAPLFAPPPDWQGMPSKGNVKILALLIEFQDHIHTNSRDDIHSNLFGVGDAARSPYESLATYYARSSYNQLDLSNGNTLGWYRTAYDRSRIPQDPTGRENLIKEVFNHFNAQGHDFSQYDNNGDGVIDYFIIIWTGPHNGWANFWWGYQTKFQDNTYKVDNVRLNRYSWQWEAIPVGSTFTPLVVIHETGHALGVPDYYDYDPSVGPNGGVGDLDMMDGNMGDHNCFTKWMLEWISPRIVSQGTHTLTLNPSGTSQEAVLVWPGITTEYLFSEFFMVQNRHRVANDNASRMPCDGMLIWHVDAHLDPSGRDFLYDNSFTQHKLVRLMEADGLEEIETGSGKANCGDYYKSGNLFGVSTIPSSKKYDGTDSLVKILDFSVPGTQMRAMFQIGPDNGGTTKLEVIHAPPPPTEASISSPKEKDTFEFLVITEGKYAIETGGNTDTYMSLFGPDSKTTLIMENDDIDGGNVNSRISTTLKAGTYFVQIRHYSVNGTGPYTIKVQAER